MTRSVLFAGLVLLFLSMNVFASSAGVNIWDADLQGSVKSSSGELNLKNDLGLADDDIVQFRLDLNMLGPKAYLHYYKAANHGTTTNVLNYNGTQLNGTGLGTVKSTFEQTIVDVNAGKSLVKTHALQVDLLGGLRYLDLSTKLRDNNDRSVSTSLKAVVPTIGFDAQTHISNDLLAKASLSGIDIRLGGKKVDTYDLRYGLEYKPTDNISIGAGIEKTKLFADDGDNRTDLHREGNYFEVVIKF